MYTRNKAHTEVLICLEMQNSGGFFFFFQFSAAIGVAVVINNCERKHRERYGIQ